MSYGKSFHQARTKNDVARSSRVAEVLEEARLRKDACGDVRRYGPATFRRDERTLRVGKRPHTQKNRPIRGSTKCARRDLRKDIPESFGDGRPVELELRLRKTAC